MCKHNARIMGFESMLKHLARLKIKRGVPPLPPHLQHKSEASKRCVCFEAKLARLQKKRGVVGWGGGPHLPTQCSRNGFRKDADALKQAGTTSSLLSFFCHFFLFTVFLS